MTGLKIIHWLCRLLLAGIFLYSGYVKIGSSFQFEVDIHAYKLAPSFLEHPLAIYLPWLEIVLGLFLLSGLKIRWSATLTAALLLFFIVVLSITYARGIDANCGCFSESDRISIKTIVRDSLILIPALYLILESRLKARFGKK
jgi:uncharacterized membrane protein YphA (DoxX/SURF4 family)